MKLFLTDTAKKFKLHKTFKNFVCNTIRILRQQKLRFAKRHTCSTAMTNPVRNEILAAAMAMVDTIASIMNNS